MNYFRIGKEMDDLLLLDTNETLFNKSGFNLTYNGINDFHQITIYNHMRKQNQSTETYRHILIVIGSIISIMGVFGKLIINLE